MYDLVDMVRHADELLIDDLIRALSYRVGEINPEIEMLTFFVERKRSFNEQADEFIAFMQQLKEKK